MYILNGQRTEIINSDYVQRFAIAKKDDGCLIVADMGADHKVVTIARYQTDAEAVSALNELYANMIDGFALRASTGNYKPEHYGPRNGMNGCKHKGHGGS